MLFQILFHYGLLQDTEYSSLCYSVGRSQGSGVIRSQVRGPVLLGEWSSGEQWQKERAPSQDEGGLYLDSILGPVAYSHVTKHAPFSVSQ